MRTQNAQRQNEKEEKTKRSVFLFDFFVLFFLHLLWSFISLSVSHSQRKNEH